MFNDLALYGLWAILTWLVHLWVYTWQMVKPVTDHPNWVRILVRKIANPGLWKIIFWRKIYKKSIQNYSLVWFTFFILLISYSLFTGIYLFDKFTTDYNDEDMNRILIGVLVISISYICVAWIALEVIIMLIIMIFMTFSLIACIGCILCWPRWLAWRPQNDNSRVNRDYFNGIVNGHATWEEVLQFLYKYKRRHFKKDRYKSILDEELGKSQSKIEEEKQPNNMFNNEAIMRLETDKNEDDRSPDKMVKNPVPSSPKVFPLLKSEENNQSIVLFNSDN